LAVVIDRMKQRG